MKGSAFKNRGGGALPCRQEERASAVTTKGKPKLHPSGRLSGESRLVVTKIII